MRELNLGKKPASVYKDKVGSAYWDGKNAQGEPAASGLYFYYLKAGDFKAADKMILAK